MSFSEATGFESSALPSRKRQLEPLFADVQSEAFEKRARRFSRGHDFSQVAIQGHAAAHLGDHHVHVSGDYNFYGPSQPVLGEGETKAGALIKWLRFPRQEARREQIEPAHRETFQWIFAEGVSLGNGATNFAEWLRTGTGLYWINGKAGSGKSTLMKMLGDDDRTRQILTRWSGGDPLIISSFYFWNAGTDMQRSILGLLRSLLCDLLEACPQVADEAFPNWQMKFGITEPVLEEVSSAFRRAVSSLPQKVCFLIDGLDEFEGDDIKKTELVKLVAHTIQQPNVKAVVSSRPLQVFRSSFHCWPSLAVHTLTWKDIKSVVKMALHSSDHFQRLCRAEPWDSYNLIENIANRSSGVFLWAVWAVNIVLDGCLHEDALGELNAKLEELPQELEQLFRTMLHRIPVSYHKEAYRYFKTALYWSSNAHLKTITCLELALAVAVEEVSANFWSGNFPPDYGNNKERRLRARLHTATQGLLEEHEGSVEFMHKSVVEFLQIDGDLLEQTLPVHRDIEFDPSSAMLLAMSMLTCLCAKPNPFQRFNPADIIRRAPGNFNDHLEKVFEAAEAVERSTGAAQCAFVDQLHRILSSCSFWDGVWDREFFALAFLKKCRLYIGEKLRSHCNTFFRFCEASLPALALVQGEFGEMDPNDAERLVDLLLSHGLGQAECALVEPHADAAIDVTRGFFCLWEILLFKFLGEVSQGEFSYYPSPVAHMFECIVEHTDTLQASSMVAEQITRHGRSRGVLIKSSALSDHFYGLLETRWSGNEHFSAKWHDRSTSTLDCPCGEARELRETIHRILQKLEDRETRPRSQLEQHVV